MKLYDYSLIIERIKTLRASESIVIECPPNVQLTAFIQRVRSIVAKSNIDYRTKISVHYIKDTRTVRVQNKTSIRTNGLSPQAEALLRDMWSGRVTPEGRLYLKDEFQMLLNTYQQKLDAPPEQPMTPRPLEEAEAELDQLRKEAAERLLAETEKMTGGVVPVHIMDAAQQAAYVAQASSDRATFRYIDEDDD
jgi:hypothetical protein